MFPTTAWNNRKNRCYNSWSTTVGHEKNTSALYVLWLHSVFSITRFESWDPSIFDLELSVPFVSEKKTLEVQLVDYLWNGFSIKSVLESGFIKKRIPGIQ